MFGINEIKAQLSACDARALRQHHDAMQEIHDLSMQIESVYSILERIERRIDSFTGIGLLNEITEKEKPKRKKVENEKVPSKK